MNATSAGRFFFVAAEGAASEMSIWSVDVATGDPVDVHPISMTGFSTPPLCLRWDPVHERLLAILSKTNGDEVLATINPATGASAAIGTGFATGGLSSGVCAFDSVNQRLYLPANLGMTGQRALFDVDTNTGTLLGAPLITTGMPVVDTTPGFVAYDAAGARVLGIVQLVPSTAGKVLVSIDVTTGALTILGDAIPAGGFSSGVSAFHQPGRDFYFLANDLATNTLNSVFGVDANGAVIADEVLRSDFVGLVLSSSFLVVVPEPGGVALGIAALAALRLLGYRRRPGGCGEQARIPARSSHALRRARSRRSNR